MMRILFTTPLLLQLHPKKSNTKLTQHIQQQHSGEKVFPLFPRIYKTHEKVFHFLRLCHIVFAVFRKKICSTCFSHFSLFIARWWWSWWTTMKIFPFFFLIDFRNNPLKKFSLLLCCTLDTLQAWKCPIQWTLLPLT